MSADDVKSAVERLTKIAFDNDVHYGSDRLGWMVGDVPTADLRTILARLDQLTEENERLTKGLVGLTCGGSEFFTRSGDRYITDVDACVAWVRKTRQGTHDLAIKSTARATKAEAERDEALVIVRKVAGLTVEGEDHTRFRANYPMFAALVACAKAILARSAQGGQRCVS